MIGFGVGYLAKLTQVERETYFIPTTITSTETATVVVRRTETQTSVVVLEPEIYIYQPPEGIEVKVAPEAIPYAGIVRLRVYVTNRRSEAVHSIYVLVHGYSTIYGWVSSHEYIDIVEPGVTRLAIVNLNIICPRYYLMTVVIE